MDWRHIEAAKLQESARAVEDFTAYKRAQCRNARPAWQGHKGPKGPATAPASRVLYAHALGLALFICACIALGVRFG